MTTNQDRWVERLAHLTGLQDGWLDGTGLAPKPEAVEAARTFLTRRGDVAAIAGLFPTTEGGVSVEFEWGGWDLTVEFGPTGTGGVYGVQLAGDASLDVAATNPDDETFAERLDAILATRS